MKNFMTLTQIKSQKVALENALHNGTVKNKHSVRGKIKQLVIRIREQERSNNFQNWLAQ